MKDTNWIRYIRKVSFIVLGLIDPFGAFGQEPSDQIKLVIIDSSGTIIKPNFRIKSKNILYAELCILESKEEQFVIDSLPKFQFDAIAIYNNQYTIYPILGGHSLDLEYNLELSYNNKVMRINIFTGSGSFSDTIRFKAGSFVYVGNNISGIGGFNDRNNFGNTRLLHSRRKKLIEIVEPKESPFSALNLDGNINKLDAVLESKLMMTNNFYPCFFIVQNLPIGMLFLHEGHLYVCYFSDDYINILKDYY
jgi:hypothetical protein